MDVDLRISGNTVTNITISRTWYNNRERVLEFTEKLKRIDKHLYCSYDVDDGYYKIYKKFPIELWGALGDWDGKDYEILRIETPYTKTPCEPMSYHLDLLRSMEIKDASYKVKRQSDWWKKYQF